MHKLNLNEGIIQYQFERRHSHRSLSRGLQLSCSWNRESRRLNKVDHRLPSSVSPLRLSTLAFLESSRRSVAVDVKVISDGSRARALRPLYGCATSGRELPAPDILTAMPMGGGRGEKKRLRRLDERDRHRRLHSTSCLRS